MVSDRSSAMASRSSACILSTVPSSARARLPSQREALANRRWRDARISRMRDRSRPRPASVLAPRGNHRLGKKIYVGNLPFSATERDLRELFERHGAIDSVNVIMDRETGRARGFAFVEMSDAASAANAIRALDGSDMGGRALRVNEAEDRRGGGGGFGGGGASGDW